MALPQFRSAVARLVVVAGLAAFLAVGSLAFAQPRGASAVIYSCSQALSLARMHLGLAQLYLGIGESGKAMYHTGRADAYMDYC